MSFTDRFFPKEKKPIESLYAGVLRTLTEYQATVKSTGEARELAQVTGPGQAAALRMVRSAEATEQKALETHETATKQYRAQWKRFGGTKEPTGKA